MQMGLIVLVTLRVPDLPIQVRKHPWFSLPKPPTMTPQECPQLATVFGGFPPILCIMHHELATMDEFETKVLAGGSILVAEGMSSLVTDRAFYQKGNQVVL